MRTHLRNPLLPKAPPDLEALADDPRVAALVRKFQAEADSFADRFVAGVRELTGQTIDARRDLVKLSELVKTRRASLQ